MNKSILILGTMLLVLFTGCRTYFGYESTREEEDIPGSQQLMSSELVRYDINNTGAQVNIFAVHNQNYKKSVVVNEYREHIYVHDPRPLNYILPIPLRAPFDLFKCFGSWNLASNPPNIFKRISYIPPVSWFVVFSCPPYWLTDPAFLKEGSNIQSHTTNSGKEITTVVTKSIEREKIEISHKEVEFTVPQTLIVREGDAQLDIAGKASTLDLANPVITQDMLPVKPLPPNTLSVRIDFRGESKEFQLNTIDILSAKQAAAWNAFQRTSHISSLLTLYKQALIAKGDFESLLSEKINLVKADDIVLLQEAKVLPEGFYSRWESAKVTFSMTDLIILRAGNLIPEIEFQKRFPKSYQDVSPVNIVELVGKAWISEEYFEEWLNGYEFQTSSELEILAKAQLITPVESNKIIAGMLEGWFREGLTHFLRTQGNTRSQDDVEMARKYFTQVLDNGGTYADFWLKILKNGWQGVADDQAYLLKESFALVNALTEAAKREASIVAPELYTLATIIPMMHVVRRDGQFLAGKLYDRLIRAGWPAPVQNRWVKRAMGNYYRVNLQFAEALAALAAVGEPPEMEILKRLAKEENYILSAETNEAKRLVNGVRGSYVPGWSSTTLGDAFEAYFDAPNWRVKELPNKTKIVEFIGYFPDRFEFEMYACMQGEMCIFRFEILADDSWQLAAVNLAAYIPTILLPGLGQPNDIFMKLAVTPEELYNEYIDKARTRELFGSQKIKECSNLDELLTEIYNYAP